MCAGEDLEAGSDRQNLAKFLGSKVEAAPTNNPTTRHEAIKSKLRHTCEAGEPGPDRRSLLQDDPPRRGADLSFQDIAGTDDLGSVAKTKDGHTCEAAEYGALVCGTAEASRRQATSARREKRREENRGAKRYNPIDAKRA
jgi:hypothetical protein